MNRRSALVAAAVALTVAGVAACVDARSAGLVAVGPEPQHVVASYDLRTRGGIYVSRDARVANVSNRDEGTVSVVDLATQPARYSLGHPGNIR